MRVSLKQLFVTLFLFATASALAAPTPLPSPPKIGASSHILMDFRSGKILAEDNSDERVEPASITKIMTGYAVFKAIESGSVSLDDMVRISEKAWRAPGSRMFIEVDTKVSVENLLKGMIIQSGNDASIALAEYVAGTEEAFADLMNQYAAQLGMNNSNFMNATGLPAENHYTTARDVAILSRAVIEEFPEFYDWYQVEEFTWNEIRQSNRNLLLYRDERVDGIKTGHTEAAGYCLASSAVEGDMRLVSVVMGTDSDKARANASQALLNYGFRFYETHRLYEAGSELTTTRVWKAPTDEIGLVPSDDVYVTIPRGRYDDLEAVMDLQQTLIAPLGDDQTVGVIRVSLDGEELAVVPLSPAAPVPEGSFVRRMIDSILLLFQ
ncbi:MAG: D-alanyl-D-alanine carboxypeptidase family protein [Gammaproteobacteria bacterium]|nr:D-alanyl-D-alanine carboxypeptidase family protein [Gammaproteobacteria bacterium]